MSNTNIPNEDALWDKLSQPTGQPAPKAETKKPEPPKSEPKAEAPKKPEPPKPEAPKPEKSGRKLDGFFYGCMAGVAAVSVAVTLLVSSMVGGGSADPTTPSQSPDATVPGESVSQAWVEDYEALARENQALRDQVELQKEQIKKLQDNLMELMGTDEYLAQIATDPTGGNEVLDLQKEAMELLSQIQAAHAESDLAKLEELIPQMDELLSYLPTTALNDYYLILEYVEQPSNYE